jgi:ABC-2 type transport system permease protein
MAVVKEERNVSGLSVFYTAPNGQETASRYPAVLSSKGLQVHRIAALMARHLYLYNRSLPRLMEVFYWPLLDLTIWGFITLYLAKFQPQVSVFATFLLGALILWDVLFRAQQAITLTFLEDVWARNLINLFGSPLKPSEFLVAAMLISILKFVAVSVVMALCAATFFSYNILALGLWLLPFVANLIVMGWAIGVFTSSLIMRFGQEASYLAWGVVFLFQPISCVFYPIEVLPAWLQPIAKMNPASHVFEGMRAVLSQGAAPWSHLTWAIGLNLIFMTCAIVWFFRTFAFCQDKGLLVRVGE